MSIPITHCKLRKALDTGNWKKIDEAMEFNRSWGMFSVFECRGHFFRKRCTFTEDEEKIINKHLGFNKKEKVKGNTICIGLDKK